MNKDTLKGLIQSSNIGIGLHPTIEANKQQAQQRQVTPPQPQRTVQSNVIPQQRPITPPQPQRTVQSNVMPQQRPITPPQPQRTVQSNVMPQQRPITPPQPQRTVQSNVMPQQRQVTPPQPQRTVQSNVMPQQRQVTPPQPQRTVQNDVILQPKKNDSYVPFNDAPILQLGDKRKEVAQKETQRVAQAVAQDSWVAQEAPQMVAQVKPKMVAQVTIADKDVETLKEQIFQIDGVDARKKFVKEIGWGILTERRGKKYYLFGAKKIDGKKYKLYIGNATA